MVTMNRLMKLFVFLFIVTASSGDEIDDSCFEMFDLEAPEQECCQTNFDFDDDDDDDDEYKDCPSDFSTDEGKCETIKCYFTKEGIWKGDELINEEVKTKLQSIDSKYPTTKKAAERILKYCLDGKYLNYGSDDSCPPMNYLYCTIVNTIVECDSWNKTETCTKYSEKVSKCKASLG